MSWKFKVQGSRFKVQSSRFKVGDWRVGDVYIVGRQKKCADSLLKLPTYLVYAITAKYFIQGGN